MPVKTKGFQKAASDMATRANLFSAQNPSKYNEVSRLLNTSIAKNFSAGGRPKWPKRTKEYPWPILVKTGTMQERALSSSLTWEHRGTEHIDKVQGPHYGPYHQYGTKKLPVRKFALVQAPEVQVMHKVFSMAFLQAK